MNIKEIASVVEICAVSILTFLGAAFLIKRGLGRKSCYKMEEWQWNDIRNFIDRSSFQIDDINRNIDEMRKQLELKKRK